jgi:hypothetical protein
MIGQRTAQLMIGVGLTCGSAVTAHADKDAFLDDSTGRLNPGEFKIGLWSVDYGLPGQFKDVQVSTATLPYLSFVAGIPSANVEVKYEPWRDGRWRSSISAGITYLRFKDYGVASNAFIVPVRALVSRRLGNSWNVLGGVAANLASTTANVESENVSGGFIGTNAQLQIGVEYELATWFHLALRRSYIAFQTLAADASTQIDMNTKAEVYVVNRIGNPLSNAYTSFDMLFGGKYVGLRLGMSYGDVELPFLHIIVPTKIPFPRGDFYLRF